MTILIIVVIVLVSWCYYIESRLRFTMRSLHIVVRKLSGASSDELETLMKELGL